MIPAYLVPLCCHKAEDYTSQCSDGLVRPIEPLAVQIYFEALDANAGLFEADYHLAIAGFQG